MNKIQSIKKPYYPKASEALNLAMHIKKEAEFQLMFKMATPLINALKSNAFSSPSQNQFFKGQITLKTALSSTSTKDSDTEELPAEQSLTNAKIMDFEFESENSKLNLSQSLKEIDDTILYLKEKKNIFCGEKTGSDKIQKNRNEVITRKIRKRRLASKKKRRSSLDRKVKKVNKIKKERYLSVEEML